MDEASALVHALCISVVCLVCRGLCACVNANKCSVMFLISLYWLCTGMDEARVLVHALCNTSVSCIPWPLLHASMLRNVLLCS